MDNLKNFSTFVLESNKELLEYDYINENLNIGKYQNMIKKFFSETKVQLYYVSTFGTSLTVILPVVEHFMEKGNFEFELNNRNITLLTIYAFCVLSHESKDKISKLYNIIKERDINDGDIKKTINILRNIYELFKITIEGTGKVIEGFLDMVAYSGLFIPFLSVVNSLITDGKISSDVMIDSFKTMELTIGAIGIKLLVHRILHKLDKIIKSTNKFQNKDNIKPLLVNDDLKSPMYKSENAFIKKNNDLMDSEITSKKELVNRNDN